MVYNCTPKPSIPFLHACATGTEAATSSVIQDWMRVLQILPNPCRRQGAQWPYKYALAHAGSDETMQARPPSKLGGRQRGVRL